MAMHELIRQATEWLLSSGLRILVIILLTLIALKVAKVLPNRILFAFSKKAAESEMKKRVDTLSSLLRYVLSTTIIAVSLIMILGEFGIAIGPILAAAGVIGLALGFGSQHLVQDVISGFFPHVTLYMGQDKKGDAASLRVSVSSTARQS
jgi:small conductance mechanosensitive channel